MVLNFYSVYSDKHFHKYMHKKDILLSISFSFHINLILLIITHFFKLPTEEKYLAYNFNIQNIVFDFQNSSLIKVMISEREIGQWTVNYISPQSFIITFFSLA